MDGKAASPCRHPKRKDFNWRLAGEGKEEAETHLLQQCQRLSPPFGWLSSNQKLLARLAIIAQCRCVERGGTDQ
jgi:hypothetical protein